MSRSTSAKDGRRGALLRATSFAAAGATPASPTESVMTVARPRRRPQQATGSAARQAAENTLRDAGVHLVHDLAGRAADATEHGAAAQLFQAAQAVEQRFSAAVGGLVPQL